jgi:tRNA-2-methylthio-N6-dimethylallyladenosine synthase
MFHNENYVGKIEMVLVEKESKRSTQEWAGRTDSNKWVIIDKSNVNIGDIIPVRINEIKGITLHGEIINIQEMEAA